ncbi:MAG: WD40 repeat domain-containing protein [Actinomycetota bacterium]|nr:WD40 repeat domain-containing protein [Actinomycetota bacterium]
MNTSDDQFLRWDDGTGRFVPLTDPEVVARGGSMQLFSPDRRQFVLPHVLDSVVQVFDVATGALVRELTDLADATPAGVDDFLGDPVLSPDGRHLVIGNTADRVAVYDTATWELVDLLDPTDGFAEIAFTNDGQRAVVLTGRGELEVRDAEELRTVLRGPVPAPGPTDFSRPVEITADDRFVKTSSPDGAQLWDLATLTEVGGPFPHFGGWAATLAPDTGQLATTVEGPGGDARVLIWDIDLDAWPSRACLAVGRNLTRAEWAEYGPSGDYRATCDHWPPAP